MNCAKAHELPFGHYKVAIQIMEEARPTRNHGASQIMMQASNHIPKQLEKSGCFFVEGRKRRIQEHSAVGAGALDSP